MTAYRIPWMSIAVVLACVFALGIRNQVQAQSRNHKATRQIMVPAEDRFLPYATTIHVGDTVKFTNNDSDDHTVVSDDAYTSAGHRGLNMLLPAGQSISLTFNRAGIFTFYCRFHAMLDATNQPIAPGPFGGIQDPNGNFGTPMAGTVTVLP
jgi:plastocyanin